MASGGEETSSPLVGICLCSETSNGHGQVIQTLHIPSTSRSQVLTNFRSTVSSTLFSVFSDRKFVFLTSHGWEINQNLEHLLKLSEVLTEENTVNIRIRHLKSRIGIQVLDHPDVILGFVFCDLSSTVADLAKELSMQLPELYKCLANRKFCFLDRNSWPITEGQESMLSVIEICSSYCVRVRLSRSSTPFQGNQILSRKISTIESDEMDIPSDLIEQQRFSLTDSLTSHFSRRALPPLAEGPETTEPSRLMSNYAEPMVAETDIDSFEILLSYVHNEAGEYARLLKDALETMGYTVFLDIHCIDGGNDWQDVLNNAITNCSMFVPLITMQYGQTLWTNREVKLADVLGKLILPVNFNKTWPPKCLAIQFATTQYISGNKSLDDQEVTLETFTESAASEIATDIAERYSKDLLSDHIVGQGESVAPLLSRQNTEIVADDTSTPSSAGVNIPVPLNLSRRKSAIKSYGSNLPDSVAKDYQMSVFESREGKPLMVISCCQKQKDFSYKLIEQMEAKGYEVWCSCDIVDRTDEEKSFIFQEKVNAAGAVIFILSKDFAEDTFCEQQVYYCEQRKRIIPLVYEPLEMPNWMATLIGTSTFITCQSQSYLTTLMDRIDTVLNPMKAENELKQVIRQKIELANLCMELEKNVPEGKLVYVSGGTKFFSKCGEAICQEIGKELAKDEGIVLITGGFFGVGETIGRSFFEERERMEAPHGVCHVVAVRDEQDKTTQTRQNPDRTFLKVPYGDTLFFGNSVRQREMLTPRVVDLCILIEGGPGAAFEAQQFVWNGNRVIPIRVTGGAAGGLFNVPSTIFIRPPSVSESDWSILGDESVSPSEIGAAVSRIVRVLKTPDLLTAKIRSRTNTIGHSSNDRMMPNSVIKRGKGLIKRSDTTSSAVLRRERERQATDKTLNAVKRTLSEKQLHSSKE